MSDTEEVVSFSSPQVREYVLRVLRNEGRTLGEYLEECVACEFGNDR